MDKAKFEKKYPSLYYLLSCYFHEDWELDAPDIDGVIRLFKKEDQKQVKKTIRDVKSFMKDVPENEYEKRFNEIYARIYPPGTGMTYKEFLLNIINILEK